MAHIKMSQKSRLGRYLVLVTVAVMVLYFYHANSSTEDTVGEVPKDLPKVATERTPQYLVRQRERNRTIHEICGPKRPLTTLTTTQMMFLLKHIIVDDNNKLLYCYVPKAACANWKRVMQVLSGKYARVEDIHKVDHTDFKFLSGYNPEEIEYRLNNYFKFMFVRHPLDRLFSAWHNKFHENFIDMQKKYGIPIVKKFRDNPPADPKGDDVTLGEFFKYLAGTATTQFNEHWMPFIELCQPCHVDYNFIGIYEDLENEATTMIKHVGLSDKVTYPARQRYYDKNSVADDAKIDEWHRVPPEAFQDVVKKYATDFGLFGYPLPENVDDYITDHIKSPNQGL